MKRLLRLILSRTTFILLLLLAQIAFFLFTVNYVSQFRYVHTVLYVITVIIVMYLIHKEENPIYKLTWIIPIMIFPLFGGLFYLFYKNTNISKKARHLYQTIEHERVEITKDMPLNNSSKITNYLHSLGFPTFINTKTTFFDGGEKLFNDLKQSLKDAKTYIYLEFFIISKGQLWTEILDILKEKVSQGVDVKLIFDDFGSSKLPYKYTKKLKSFGIDAYNFNPMKPHLNFQMNYRNHRKVVIIDGHIAYTGGINIGDEYINLVQPFGHWQDSGIKLEGEAVFSLLAGFLDQLRFLTTGQLKIDYKPIKHDQTANKSLVVPFFDAPLDLEYTTKNIYMQMIYKAKSYIYIATPYLILDYELMTALKFAASSGVDVNIMIPYIPDKRIIYMVTESYARELSEFGIKVFKYEPGFIHSKFMIVDDSEALIGTVNLDFRSLFLHFENSVYLKNDSSIIDMKNHFQELITKSIDINLIKKPNIIYRFTQIILKGFSSIL